MSKKKRFVVESIQTFSEVNIVFAENEEEAKKIAAQSDYNTSKWLGNQVVRVHECKDADIERYKTEDSYFFDGAATIDDENFLVYTDLEGKVVNENMPKYPIS
jgi:predicted membrane protein